MNPILEIKNLSFSFQKGKPFFSDFNLTVNKNEIIGLLGSNGAGKTTLFELISGQKKNFSGEILLNDKNLRNCDLKEKAKLIAYIRQNQNQQNSYLDAFHFILEGRRPYTKFGNYSEKDHEIVRNILEEYDLSDFSDTLVSSLSGGEYQRCVLARAMAQQTDLILCDEPFSAMDMRYQKEFRDKIIAESQKKGTAFLIILHNVNFAISLCIKIIFLKYGKILFQEEPKKISTDTLRETYDTEFEMLENNGKKFFSLFA